eukprot:TRINITY_DN15516_c0_g1_i1.p1 TRINITY_DN15516_c0_g1~~TRINITY_DN15516_c0_g1_i1.p1  ORF type:complete len:155 (+),score=19.01 TRINITY_DN15516_c0_g1_i1:13-477(+)
MPNFCEDCGSTITTTQNFCEGCGKNLQELRKQVASQEICARCRGEFDQQNTMLTALGQKWHRACFLCVRCSAKIPSFAKFGEEDGKPVCPACFKNVNVPNCQGCKKPVGDSYTNSFNFSWHPDCLRCATCKKEGGKEGLFEDGGKLYHLNCFKF